jgi:IclR family pca regulon transcriptional regulator
VLLAALPRAELSAWLKAHPLPKVTPHTVTDVRQLRAVLDRVRADDFCVASEEHELGIHALAIPLRNLQGRTVAALNVVAPPARLMREALERTLLPALLDAARELRPLL